jgi:modulator of FtsH protease HflK
MPWSKDGGGGNQGGPWGQGPRGPQGGGRGPTPPDLDDLIRKGQDSLKQILPLGGGRGTWAIPLLLIAAFWLYNSIYQVQADERGVVLRFGAYSRTVPPGLHFAAWPLETLETPKVSAEQIIDFGNNESESLMLTGDQNIVDMQFTVLWRIDNPENFLFNIQTPQEAIVKAVAESAMREIVGRTSAQEIRTTGKLAIQDQVKDIVQNTLNSYNSGILITAVKLQKVDPPSQVIQAFEEVQRAEQNQAQRFNEANLYTNQQTRKAEGEVGKLMEDAKAYKARVVAEAQGESQRFLSVYEQYKNAKDVTRQRMFLETMEDVLSKANKVIVEGGSGQGVMPYLQLPQIAKPQAPAKEGTQQ